MRDALILIGGPHVGWFRSLIRANPAICCSPKA